MVKQIVLSLLLAYGVLLLTPVPLAVTAVLPVMVALGIFGVKVLRESLTTG